jgi:hypothetical protein
MERMDCSHPVFERHPTLCAVGNRRTARVMAIVQPQDQTSHRPRLLGTGTSSAELLLGDGVGRRRSSRNNKVAVTDVCIYPRAHLPTQVPCHAPQPTMIDRPNAAQREPSGPINIHGCSRYLSSPSPFTNHSFIILQPKLPCFSREYRGRNSAWVLRKPIGWKSSYL